MPQNAEDSRNTSLSTRELATVLAALRLWQDFVRDGTDAAQGLDHFYDHKPLDASEIDELCERLNCVPVVHSAKPQVKRML